MSPNPRILYVDDEEALVVLATRVLSRMGCEVVGHSEPRQALADFRSRPMDFQLVITDVSMPAMTGPQLLAEVRKLRPDLRAILTSGCITPESVEQAERLGNAHLVAKPSTIDAYVNLLTPLLMLEEQRAS